MRECQSQQNQKKQEEQQSPQKSYTVVLTSCVIAAIISGAFSVFTAWNTNEKLKDIEIQKHQYELQEARYEKLQEALEFFVNFEVYDPKFIFRFDIDSEDYSIDGAIDMYYDSSQEFLSQTLKIVPYLSDEALDILEENGLADIEEWKKDDVDINELINNAKVNAAVKEHLESVNSKFDLKKIALMQALTHDLSKHYVYLQFEE